MNIINLRTFALIPLIMLQVSPWLLHPASRAFEAVQRRRLAAERGLKPSRLCLATHSNESFDIFREFISSDDSEEDDWKEPYDDDDADDDWEFELEEDNADNSASSSPLTLDDLSASFSANVSYFYLKNELGLSEGALWRITYEAGSALGMTAATIKRKVQVLRDTMNLSDDDIRTLLERHPTILHLSADKNIAPTILFLVRALDLSKDELRALVLASPAIISYKRANIRSKLKFFTSLMNFTIAECRELFLAEPNLLRASVRTGLMPKMRFWLREIEVPLNDLRRLVQQHPRILIYSLDDNLIPKVVFFMIMTLQMSTTQVQKLLRSYPNILSYNLDRHILPLADYCLKDLEFSPNELTSILLKCPRFISHSLRKIKHIVGYLRFELAMSASQVKRVLYQAPQVLGLNTENNFKTKVNWLRSELGLSDEQLRIILGGMPTLLVLNTETNLGPKLVFLTQSFGRNEALVREAVLRLPTLLGYSLDQRIRPRMTAILKAGVDQSSITVGIPMKEEVFRGWLGRREIKDHRQRSAIVPSPTKRETDRSGRIVHWNRENPLK